MLRVLVFMLRDYPFLFELQVMLIAFTRSGWSKKGCKLVIWAETKTMWNFVVS